MNLFKILLVVALGLTSAYAADLPQKELVVEKKEKPKLESVYINILFNISQDKISHQENSGFSGFYSLDDIIRIKVITLDLEVMKELFPENMLSVSVFGRGGILEGTSHQLSKNTSDYKEKLLGKHFGGGLSLNTNFIALKTRVQPFVGFSFAKGDSRYKLNYSLINSANKIRINYSSDDTSSTASFGIRFLDSRVDLLSVFAVNYTVSSKSERKVDGSVGNSQLSDLTDLATAKHSPLSVVIGLGFLY